MPQQTGMSLNKYRRSPQRVQVQNVSDFTGGLNLVTDTFKLAANESPDIVNLDVNRRGGVQTRRAVESINSTVLSADPRSMWRYQNSGGVSQIMAQVGNDILYSTGSNFTSLALTTATSGPAYAATFNDFCYIQRHRNAPLKWNGSAVTTLTANGTTWQDSLLSPTGGYMPAARFVVTHGGYAWCASTLESGTTYRNRLRWSHPNSAEDWRKLDYVDIEVGKDGDEITGLIPFGDHLVVLKRNSMYAVYGYSADTFSVVNISNTVGAVSQQAALNTIFGLYVYDPTNGVHRYTGTGQPQWVFDQLFPAVRDGSINAAYLDQIALGWVEDRLWVSVPWKASTTRNRVFVLNPLGGGTKGSWTAYDLKSGPFTELGDTPHFGQGGTKRIMRLASPSAGYDDFGDGQQTPIPTSYTTSWLDAGQPAMKKRWKRAEFVLRGGEFTNVDLIVDVNIDWDRSTPSKSFTVSAPAVASNNLIWDTSTWDSSAVFIKTGSIDVLDRGVALGLSRSVSLTISGPAACVTNWGLDSISYKFVPRRIR
jgi:hypothetical protein